jgi:hypothetical protein
VGSVAFLEHKQQHQQSAVTHCNTEKPDADAKTDRAEQNQERRGVERIGEERYGGEWELVEYELVEYE